MEETEELEGHIKQLLVQKDKAYVKLDKVQKLLHDMREKRGEAEASDSEWLVSVLVSFFILFD